VAVIIVQLNITVTILVSSAVE